MLSLQAAAHCVHLASVFMSVEGTLANVSADRFLSK